MRKKKHPEHVNHERWLVSYADFITLLFAFFTTLYAVSTVDQKKAGKLQFSMMTAFNNDFFPSTQSSAAQESIISAMDAHGAAPVGTKSRKKSGGNRVGALASTLEQLAARIDIKGRIQVKQTQNSVVISLNEATFFPSGSAELKKEAIAPLTEVGNALYSARDSIELTIEGHSDNVPMKGGRYHSNWELSTARAAAVLETLLEAKDFDPSHVAASGYGEHRPIASNATAEGRGRNRRVDIVARMRSQSEGQARSN